MKKLLILPLLALALAACSGSKSGSTADSQNQAGYSSEATAEAPIATPSETADQDDATTSSATPANAGPWIVDFSAEWCPPCQKLKPEFKMMEKEYAGRANFRTVDVDAEPDLANAHNVTNIPCVIIFADKEMKHEITRIVGYDPDGLDDAITDALTN